MRLIGAEKISNYIKSEINPYGKPFEGTVYEFGLKLMKYLENASVDYDLDNVVRQLKTDSSVKLYGSDNSNNYLISLEKAIEIVKAGGMNNNSKTSD